MENDGQENLRITPKSKKLPPLNYKPKNSMIQNTDLFELSPLLPRSNASLKASISVIKEESSNLEQSNRSIPSKLTTQNSKITSAKTPQKSALKHPTSPLLNTPTRKNNILPKTPQTPIPKSSNLTKNHFENTLIKRLNRTHSKIKRYSSIKQSFIRKNQKDYELNKEMSKYRFHEMSDPAYNMLYATMMKDYAKNKQNKTRNLESEMGHNEASQSKQASSLVDFKEISKKAKKRGLDKRKLVSKLFKQKLKVKRKCFKHEKKNYKERVHQISYQVEKIMAGDPHRKYIIEEYNKSTFEKYLHYKRIKKLFQ
ncbi:unnamed protein product [Moneuplotes crassus]|uniref:Uncharacterized protein n=1 Tax=Euplotes crassus TaxID=5936 RepID=A0AAD1Y6D6_EUPCR|nr:unnamed protein product [Moneuplotes crassus]